MSNPIQADPSVTADSIASPPNSDRLPPVTNDCWNRIGVSGDRSCPELESHIHCRNCPVFADAARSFFDRQAPEGYLTEWTNWLANSSSTCEEEGDDLTSGDEAALTLVETRGEIISLLIFRLNDEWLAVGTRAVSEVTTLRPVHRIPHRSNAILTGLVNLRGQLLLCVSLHGLLSVGDSADSAPGTGKADSDSLKAPKPRLVVLRDRERSETWAFVADEVLGIHRVSRGRFRVVPATLANPTVSFSQAVFSWNSRSVGFLDEGRIFSTLRRLDQ